MPSPEFHRRAVYWGSILLAVGLPLSTVLMSIGQFLLAGNWLLERRYAERVGVLKGNWIALSLMSLWAVHIIWLIPSTDLGYGWHDAQMKLPLLLLPLFFFTSEQLKKHEANEVLWMFVVACAAGALAGATDFYGFHAEVMTDRRELSLFTSHIRFSLMLCVAIAFAAHQLYLNWKKWPVAVNGVVIATTAWLFWFLVLLESFNGYLAFAGMCASVAIWGMVHVRRPAIRRFWFASVALAIVASAVYLANIAAQHFESAPINWDMVPHFTANGRPYSFRFDEPQRENGHRVWFFISMEELDQQWPRRSTIPIDSADRKGQPIRFTLIRYITSLGLPKDSAAVHALSANDVRAIENGVTNYRFRKTWGVERRFDEALWEVENYLITGRPGNSSMIQRLVHARAGWAIFRDNWLFGTGTGDVKDAFTTYYRTHSTGLEQRFWARTHNQLLTFLLTFGIAGGIWCILTLVLPVALNRRSAIFVAVWTVATISMFGDDTLETQAGATFVAFFFTFLSTYMTERKSISGGMVKKSE